jgi:hypothetical protein
MSENPFALAETVQEADKYYYTDVLPTGEVVKYKKESGTEVVVENLGDIKLWFRRAIEKASVMTLTQLGSTDTSELTHIELAAIKLAVRASDGDLNATKELLDRVLGRAKQYNENTNVNMTLDDVLKQMESERE